MVFLFLLAPGYLFMLLVERTHPVGALDEGSMIRHMERLLIGAFVSLIIISTVYLMINFLLDVGSQGLLLWTIGSIYLMTVLVLMWRSSGFVNPIKMWHLRTK